MEQDFLVLKNITKSFGQTSVIDNLNLTIKKGTMVTLLGPSGCGKTTVLRLVAGLESPTSGQIFIDGEEVTHSAIQQRDICIVFQSYALFPHMSIGDNVGYGLKMQGVPKAERILRVKEALALVNLTGFEDRFVDQISGGQQQRVALARALILKPKVLLFDEPLSNLDANLRRAMRESIRALQQQLNITALYVTHDQNEAFAVSDQVIVMDKGKIQQQDTAQSLYQQPNSLFLANFMGESTILPADKMQDKIQIGQYCFPLPPHTASSFPDGSCLFGIRPEAVKLHTQGEPEQRCRIHHAVYMGAYWEILVEWQTHRIMVHLNPDHYQAGLEEYFLTFSPTGIFLLPPAP